jgi:hypothetical protein
MNVRRVIKKSYKYKYDCLLIVKIISKNQFPFEDTHISPHYISNRNMWLAFIVMIRLHWKEKLMCLNSQEHTNHQYIQNIRFWKWWLRTIQRGNVVWNGNREGINLLKFACMYCLCHFTLKNVIEHEVVSYLISDIQIILDCSCVSIFKYLTKCYYSIYSIKLRKHQLFKFYCNTAQFF